jgi:hypothetical protein
LAANLPEDVGVLGRAGEDRVALAILGRSL